MQNIILLKDSSSIEVRPATNQDGLSLAKLQQDVYGIVSSTEWATPLVEFPVDSFAQIYVAEHHSSIVGLVSFKAMDSNTAEIEVMIAPPFQQKGLGKQLLVYAIHKQKSTFSCLNLIVLRDHAAALHIYEQLGFNIIQSSPIAYQLALKL